MIYLKPNHKPIRQYHALLGSGLSLSATQKVALKQAFRHILELVAREKGYQIVAQLMGEQRGYAMVNHYFLPIGYWISVNESDDLELSSLDESDTLNLMIQAPQRICLYQHGQLVREADIRDANEFVSVIQDFFEFEAEFIQQWSGIEAQYAKKVQQSNRYVQQIIRAERKSNIEFVKRMRHFISICKQALSSGISVREVDQMLVQHLLTSPLFDLLFGKKDFVLNNAIAQEMEHVLDAISLEKYNQIEWVELYPFYLGVVDTYNKLSWRWGQGFIETVYRRFFHHQHEEENTSAMLPQPIVQFMTESADELLQLYCGQKISDRGINVLDPFLGTGTFLLSILQYIGKRNLTWKFESELHGNERRLLPYYLASLNIEQEYKNLTKQEKPFNGICLVDTFGLAELRQASLFNPENMERITNQAMLPMHVILGSPPMELAATSLPSSTETSTSKMPKQTAQELELETSSLPWVKALIWAIQRIHDQGVVAFCIPNTIRFEPALASIRKQFLQDFSAVYILDVGVIPEVSPEEMCLLFLVKDHQYAPPARVYLKTLPEYWESAPILHFLEQRKNIRNVDWEQLRTDVQGVFPNRGLRKEYASFLPLYGRNEHDTIFAQGFSGQTSANLSAIFAADSHRDADKIRVFSQPFAASWQVIAPDSALAKSAKAIFPTTESCKQNRIIAYSIGDNGKFYCNQMNGFPLWADASVQYVPFYLYDERGDAIENIQDAVIAKARAVYKDDGIHKWAFFQYLYALMHHPEFREKYRINLQEGIPHIPLVNQFWRFVEAGKTLSGIHNFFDEIQPHRLSMRKSKDEALRFDTLKLSKDKTSIMVDKGCSIEAIPSQSLVYTFKDKPIIQSVLTAYQKEWQRKSGVEDVEWNETIRLQTLMRHLGQVVNVSLETQRLIENMPSLDILDMASAPISTLHLHV